MCFELIDFGNHEDFFKLNNIMTSLLGDITQKTMETWQHLMSHL
jgi:hypothetical protein